MTIWRMRIACSVPKATKAHSEYVAHCFSTVIIDARTRLDITLYVCIFRFENYERRLKTRR